MPISRSQMPRQMYGLGSIVKSIGKTIKKVVKSPIGKAAILGLGAYGLGGGFGAGFKFGNLPGASLFSGKGAGLASMFGKAKNFIGANKMLAAGSLGLASLAGAPEEVQMESQRNVGALRQYLSSYYKNLGYSDNQIAENVARDTSEYTSGQGGYANGGRIGYESGTEDPLAEFLKRKIPSVKMPDPFKKFLDNMTPEERETFITIQKNNAKRMPKRNLSEEAMKKIKIQNEIRKKQAEEMGLPPTMKLLANGGRINRAYGSDDLVEQASGMEGLDININPKGVKELDLRDSGGFIPPVGIKEKADDIPAMLSNNEFVFTADAVRAAGGGSVNKGAQVMYDAMKKLENGGKV